MFVENIKLGKLRLNFNLYKALVVPYVTMMIINVALVNKWNICMFI